MKTKIAEKSCIRQDVVTFCMV